jgi:prepilin-type N-terminal cleavage/methylation domain-containing protein/prepilin-type processing-associated H-X9-DG protein
MKRSPKRHNGRAFTLIELLVVMAVIGVLAGILLPVLARAREQGRRTECLSNLGQAQKALVIYGNSFSEYFPSHHCWGLTVAEYKYEGETLTNYADDYGISRNMVIGYGAETTDPGNDLAPDGLTFIPVGLGIVVARGDLTADVLTCPGMSGTISTYYGAAEYEYTSAFPRNVARSGSKPLVTADGGDLYHTEKPGPPKTYVTAMLSAYSYRNHPFYSRETPYKVPDSEKPWSYTNDFNLQKTTWTKEWVLDFTGSAANPEVGIRAEFMCPPFKSARQLGGRAIISDSFDYAPSNAGGKFTQGLGMYAHKEGYNVAYGDGHVAWFDDENGIIANWGASDTADWPDDWSDEDNPETDNLTISSMSSQRAWNQFDRAAEIDKN